MYRKFSDILTTQTVDTRFKTVIVDPDNGSPDGDGTENRPIDTIPHALDFLNDSHCVHGVIYLLPGKTYRVDTATEGDWNPIIRTPILHITALSDTALSASEQPRIEIASKVADGHRLAYSLSPGANNIFTYFYNVFLYGEQGDTNYSKSNHFSLIDVFGATGVMFQNCRIESGSHCVVSIRDDSSGDVVFNNCGIKAIDTLALVDINFSTARLSGYSNGFDTDTIYKVYGVKTDSNGAYQNALIDIDNSNDAKLDW